ncbi:MAG: 4Fe-4S ferredoxin, partial [Spirochaetaceae bacterium]|nr:4Fe-4S ferredoxin [Spirochaetaceae bacterium]
APKGAGEGCGGGCPGSASRRFAPLAAPARAASSAAGAPAAGAQPSGAPSALTHWPIQLHLVNPRAPQFAGADLLVAADCTAFALGSFHADLLAGRGLVIACPKLDQGREIYVDKLAVLLEGAASVTIAIMEVPCCSGLLKLLLEARERSARKPPVDAVVLGIEGGIKRRSSY